MTIDSLTSIFIEQFCEEYGMYLTEIKAVDIFNGVVIVSTRPRKKAKRLLWVTIIVDDETGEQ